MGGSSKKVTVGYRYYLGLHMVLCHGPIDKLVQLFVDKRAAWGGNTSGGSINVAAADLFGGESREGGVSGTIDFENGGPGQGVNPYLQSRIGGDVPAFRGVAGLVFRQFYLGLNPYLKSWSFRAQRIHTRQNGLLQWYDAKSEIFNQNFAIQVLNETFSGGLDSYTVETGAASTFTLVSSTYGSSLRIAAAQSATIPRLSRPVGPSLWNTVRAKFRIDAVDIEDCGLLEIFDGAGNLIFNFTPVRDASVDSLRRAHLSFVSGESGLILSDAQLSLGVWYQLTLTMDRGTNALSGTITRSDDGQMVKSATGLSLFSYGLASKVTFRAENSAAPGGISLWDDVEVYESVNSDMNPAHIIRECLTDPDWGMGYQDSDMDDPSFRAAADTLYSENFGISLLWDRQTPIEDFVKEVVRHIQASLYVDRITGKFVLKLIRADYVTEDLLVLDESSIEKVENFARPSFGDMVNSITVNYWDSKTAGTASITAQDTALIQMHGAVIGTTIQYPGCTKNELAAKLATRDLRTLSTPLLSCTVYANRKAAGLNVGDPFVLSWPDYLTEPTVMRVIGLALGDGKSNRVKITCVEDAFSFPETAIVRPETPEWVDPSSAPTAALYRVVVEAPYYELVQRLGQTTTDENLAANAAIGYLLGTAAAPSGAINARLVVDAGAGYEGNDTPMDFCPVAFLAAPVDQKATALTLVDASGVAQVTVGTHAQIGEELVRVDSVGDTAMTAGRGVLDTVPATHPAGTPVYFWDAYADSDGVEYAAGETVDVKMLPVTGSGQLALADAPVDSLAFVSRAFRPYPPGNFRVDGLSYPVLHQVVGNPVLTWAHRDRLQQTAGTIYDHTAGNIGPEAGTTYVVQSDAVLPDGSVVPAWFDLDVGSVTSYTLNLSTNVPPTDAVDLILRVYAKRDSALSLQAPQVRVNLFGAPTNVTATYIPVDSPYDLVAVEI